MLICGAATDSGRSLLRCTDIQQHNGHNRTLNCTLCKINMVLAALTPGRLGGQRNESGGGGFQERSRRRCFLPLTKSTIILLDVMISVSRPLKRFNICLITYLYELREHASNLTGLSAGSSPSFYPFVISLL